MTWYHVTYLTHTHTVMYSSILRTISSTRLNHVKPRSWLSHWTWSWSEERERDAEREGEREMLVISIQSKRLQSYNKMLLHGSFWSRLAFCEPNWYIYIYKLIRAEAVLRENLIEQFLGRFSSGVRQALDVFIQWTCSLSACKTICIEFHSC